MQDQHSIINSMRDWYLPMGGSQNGPISGQPFLQSLFNLCSCISFRQKQFWVESFVGGLVDVPIPPLGVLSDYLRWSLWVFWLRSPTLSSGSLSHLKSLVLSRVFSHPPTLAAAYFHSSFWPSGPLLHTPSHT